MQRGRLRGERRVVGGARIVGLSWVGPIGVLWSRAVGHRLLGGGSPVIEYASVTDTIEKVMVYV